MRRVLLKLVDERGTREFPLEDVSVCRIGRSEQSTVALSGDGRVSRNHAIVQRMDTGEYFLTDLGSRNGTILNGRQVVNPTVLRSGDLIRLGNYELVFVQEWDSVQPAKEAETEEEKTTALVDLRLVTVLVIDIRNYTSLSRELGEPKTSEMMSSVFRAAGLALAETGSYAQKYIGDAVMAIWVHDGARPSQSDLQSVFGALCRLAGIVEGMQREFSLSEPVRFGAGLNCGVAGLGNMGSAALADHTAMGECVNKAFRLESVSKELGYPVVVGQGAYDFFDVLPDLRTALRPRMAELKGYAQAERVYVVDTEEIRTLLPTA